MQRHRSRIIKKVMSEADPGRYAQGFVDGSQCYGFTTARPSWQPYPLHEEWETMDDVVTPQFHTRSTNGDIIMNPMSYEYSLDVRTPHTRQSGQYGAFNGALHGTLDYGNNVGPFNEWLDYAIQWDNIPILYAEHNDVLIEAHAAAKAASFETLVFLGELHKSIALLRTLGKRLVRLSDQSFYRDLRRGTLANYYRVSRGHSRWMKRSFKASVRRSAREWLQYRYGIMQVLYDYQNALRLVETLRRPPRTRFVRSTSQQQSWSHPGFSGSGYTTNDQVVIGATQRDHLMVTAGVLVEPKMGSFGHVVDATGIIDILPTVWEMTRLSFVVDWFVGVGSWLESQSPEFTKTILGSWITTERTRWRHYDCRFSTRIPPGIPSDSYFGSGYGPFSTGTVHNDLFTVDQKRVWRDRIVNPPLPDLPAVKVQLNPGRIIDLASLVTQRLR